MWDTTRHLEHTWVCYRCQHFILLGILKAFKKPEVRAVCAVFDTNINNDVCVDGIRLHYELQ